MSHRGLFFSLLLFAVAGSNAQSSESPPASSTIVTPTSSTDLPPLSPSTQNPNKAILRDIEKIIEEAENQRKIKIANKIRHTLKNVKQMTQPDGLIEKAVRTNFLHSLYQMANNTAITGTNVSRAAGTLIRGFVQDQFNLASIAFYFPRLIFLDGPTQFIETLRLIRSNQLRAPMNMNEAIDTLINFAAMARESQITMNTLTPFLSIWPNIFRGSELLATEVLYSVFQWLGPLSPTDVSSASIEGLWNRWDLKASTTVKYDFDKKWKQRPQ